jgi:hypothetical protein
MKFFLLIILFLVVSCAVKKDEEMPPLRPNKEEIKVVNPYRADGDEDGDLVSNGKEKELGRNFLVSDIPKLKVNFIQNFRIEGSFKNIKDEESGTFHFDTKVRRDSGEYLYRTGKVFIREKAFDEAARIGKFEGHSWGEINDIDTTRVSYPEIEPVFYSEFSLSNKKYFENPEYSIEGLSVTLSNTLRLKDNDLFTHIKNLKLNFYYWDYENEAYQLLKTAVLKEQIHQGIQKSFEVKIEDLPRKFILDNFLKKGEFIVAEVEDYEIPELDTSYRKLMASVRSKTTALVYNTPLESKVYYVSSTKKKKFAEILKEVFDLKYTIEGDKLTKIRDFENNLSAFTHLKEIKNNDKEGRWFVFSSKLERHYLDHDFAPGDKLVLSYVMGNELATRVKEKTFSFSGVVDGGEAFRTYSVGESGLNSVIDIQIEPIKKWGERVKVVEDVIQNISNFSDFLCNIRVSTFSPYDESFSFSPNMDNEARNLSLIVGSHEYSIVDLINEKKIKLEMIGKNIHLKITDIEKIHKSEEEKKFDLKIKLKSTKQSSFNGVWLYRQSGSLAGVCSQQAANLAYFQMKVPVSNRSIALAGFRRFVPQGLVIKGEKSWVNKFSVSINSIIRNFQN